MAYAGQAVRLPLGELGLTGSRALSQVPPQGLLQATNISWDQGDIRKEGGATAYNTSALGGGASILAGHDWWPVPGVQRLIVSTSGGFLYRDDGAGTFTTTLKSGLSGLGVPVFCEVGQETLTANRKLFYATGYDPVQVIAGDAAIASTITLGAADWSSTNQPNCLAEHDGRLWASLGNRVYFSTQEDHEDFQDTENAGSLVVGAGSGEKIVQIMSYKGVLLVWKFPIGIFLVDTNDPLLANWTVRRLSNSIGGASPQGAVQISDDILFLDQSGNFQLLSGIQEYGTIGLKNLSQLNLFSPFMRDNVALGYLYQARGIFYAHKLEAHFAITKLGQTANTARIVVDFNQIAQARFRWSDRDTCPALWLYKESDNIQRPMVGDTGGIVWKLDRDTFTQGATGYTATIQTAYMDFKWLDPELAVKRKNGQFLELVCDATGSWDLRCDIYWDGTFSQTLDFTSALSGAVLGTWIIGTDPLGGSSTITIRKRVAGSGKRISFKFYNAETSEGFNLSEAYFSFLPADERIV